MSRPVGTAEELERRRRRAVDLVRRGERPAQVARFLGVHRSSVSRWRAAAQRRGGEALAARPHPHRPPQLTDLQLRALASSHEATQASSSARSTGIQPSTPGADPGSGAGSAWNSG